jgi:hypothetical protein
MQRPVPRMHVSQTEYARTLHVRAVEEVFTREPSFR